MHGLIAVRNHGHLVDDTTVRAWADACRKQAKYHACPLWGLAPVPVIFVSTFEPSPPGAWEIVIFDHADQANALGYHDRTPNGVPYGRVFVAETERAGLNPCSVLSHEIVEAVGDPIVNTWRDYPDGGRQVAAELCDPCQGNIYQDRRGFWLSDFVLPSWFTPGADGPYTFMDAEGYPDAPNLIAPFEIASNGYAIVRTAGRISNVFGARYADERRDMVGLPGSRTSRR